MMYRDYKRLFLVTEELNIVFMANGLLSGGYNKVSSFPIMITAV